MEKAEIGLIGLGTMGSNLALNIAEKGHRIAVFNRTVSRVDEFKANAGDLADRIVPCKSLAELDAGFRARLAGVSRGRGTFDALVGAGFMEIQRTARDAAGFRFGPAREAAPIEAAGPEISGTLKGRYFADPGARTFVTADVNVGAAAIPAAPAVLGRGGAIVPFGMVTIGVGF